MKAIERDYDLSRVYATSLIQQKSGSRSPVSNSLSFSGMLFWNRAVITEEELIHPGIIRDLVELIDSNAPDSNMVDTLDNLCAG